MLPMQGAQGQSLVGGLRSHMPSRARRVGKRFFFSKEWRLFTPLESYFVFITCQPNKREAMVCQFYVSASKGLDSKPLKAAPTSPPWASLSARRVLAHCGPWAQVQGILQDPSGWSGQSQPKLTLWCISFQTYFQWSYI